MNSDIFQDRKKLRRASVMSPPNVLKEKMGSGGVSEILLTRAQELIDNNTIDFMPLAKDLVQLLHDSVAAVRDGKAEGEEAIAVIIYPAMQLKAQGSMFHMPLVTDLADILVNFLETVEEPDADVLEISAAHATALSAVLSKEIKADSQNGKDLCTELLRSCERYYKKHDISPEDAAAAAAGSSMH